MLPYFCQLKRILQFRQYGFCSALYRQYHLRPVKKNGFVMMYKYKGQSTEDLASVLCQKLNTRNIKLIEDLDMEDEGLVSYALGSSKFLLPYVNDINTYKVSIKVSNSANEPAQITKKDVITMISDYIGQSRQEQIESLDDSDSDCSVVRSYPIQINDITIKQFKSPQIDLLLHCLQGCDIRILLDDMENKLQAITHQTIHFDCSVIRTKHCGIDEKSPLCVDEDDVASSMPHTTVLPWYVLNDVTMLHHLSVAYFESHRLFYQLQDQNEVPIDHGITFYEHWNDESPVEIKPIQKLPVMIITSATKKLQQVDRLGKRKMNAIPPLFRGIGHVDCIKPEVGSIKMDLRIPSTVASRINLDSIKSKQYFHKTHKNQS